MLKRPRNRQPRAQGQQQQRPNNGRQNGPSRSNHHPKSSSIPTVQQVVPGASVSIVLKADQPTGRETPGVVQDVLTQGNHPRGIKVRLQDGQVGRVQRMGGGSAGSSSGGAADASGPSAGRNNFTQRYTDVRFDDEYPEGPPPRSLADFFPAEPEPETSSRTQEALVTCPLCGDFEGDETAVTHHIEKEHLT
ncbi:unnamed protein product [Clonostachys rhizophaga]|uniref:UBZ4-type domain-containing protein n=1 Tax=Clonostachys rhizophaga TaxID=160324 RepID=A0A9N9VUZ2_9HYPO|nr:unnamed protein product [Clonostachys rhizophaga]